jgi:transposase
VVLHSFGSAAGTSPPAAERCADLQALILERRGVDYHERTIGKLLDRLGFSHITARPRHYRQDEAAVSTPVRNVAGPAS